MTLIPCHQNLMFIFLLFCYSSQQFDEEDEDETDGKPNPAAAAKAALGMILCQFKVVSDQNQYFALCPTEYKKRTVQFLRVLHVYCINNFIAF